MGKWSTHLATCALLCWALLCFCLPVGCGGGGDEPNPEPTKESATPDAGKEASAPDRVTEPPAPTDGGGKETPTVELKAAGSVPAYAVVGKEVAFDASASKGATQYRWSFGDGQSWENPRETPDAKVTYKEAGRFQVLLEVFDAEGNSDFASFSIAVVQPKAFAPRESSTIIRLEGGDNERIVVVSPDSNEVTLIERNDETFKVLRRIKTMKNPRTLSQQGDWLLVTCQDDDALQALSLSGTEALTLTFDYGSRPYGVVVAKDKIYVTLQAKGQVAEVAFDGKLAPTLVKLHEVVKDARGIALLPDGRLAVSRWRSPADRGVVAALEPSTGKVELWSLQFDPQKPSDTEIGGVPNYLNQLLVSPTGQVMVLPSLQANIRDGLAKSGLPLRDDTTLRGIVSQILLPSGKEDFQRRRQFDSRGFFSSGVFSSRGDYLFVTARGGRIVERVDMLSNSRAGTIFDTGFAPEGVTLSTDDRFLYVNAYLSRQVVVFDVRSFDTLPKAVAKLAIPTQEPLTPVLLKGKQLFNDSSDPRLSKENYIACAHCHLEGDSDHLIWDFTQRGEGLRNTISMLGRKGAGDGPIHWSGNFDEIHDFEHDIRQEFGGKGLMTDEQFNQGTRNTTLGDPKAGVSADLDAMAAYITSLATHRRSPFRAKDGSLTDAATRGKALFVSNELGCTTCHKGDRLTDSAFTKPQEPLLHDVGTLKPSSGKRLNQTLTGIDTPTLHGVWDSAPFLHDGSAMTLKDVLTTHNKGDKHGKTSQLTPTQLDDLIAYLRSLDGKAD